MVEGCFDLTVFGRAAGTADAAEDEATDGDEERVCCCGAEEEESFMSAKEGDDVGSELRVGEV